MIMHRRVMVVLVTAGLGLGIAVPAEAGCTIYQHRDYGGSRWGLGHFERMKMVNGESIGCTTNGHGSGCESVTYNASWNDHVSSFKVTPGCRLTLWEHVNARGIRFDKPGSYKYVGGRFNDKASEALCMCQ